MRASQGDGRARAHGPARTEACERAQGPAACEGPRAVRALRGPKGRAATEACEGPRAVRRRRATEACERAQGAKGAAPWRSTDGWRFFTDSSRAARVRVVRAARGGRSLRMGVAFSPHRERVERARAVAPPSCECEAHTREGGSGVRRWLLRVATNRQNQG